MKGGEHIRLEALKDDVGISCCGQTGWICRRMDVHQPSNVKSNLEKQYIFIKLKSIAERKARYIILDMKKQKEFRNRL